MKKFASLLLFYIPLIVFSANPPPPGLPDEPVAASIDSMVFMLLAAGIVLGCCVIGKRKSSTKKS